ncbi:MAG: YoaK family protein [Jatrophihabitantaceae bacterium]
MSPRTADRDRRVRHALVVVLTVNAGATDSIGFLALGGAFTSVMTGNLVLLGISAAHADGSLARHTVTAILCYVLGCILGARLAGIARDGDRVWPAQITRALTVELAVFGVYALGWWITDGRPVGAVQLGLLAVNAVGLGIQSSAVQRFGVSGLSTTYMTGTLTTLIVRLTSGHRLRDVMDSGQILLALIGGAVLSGVLNRYLTGWVPVLQLVSIGGVIAASTLLTPLRRPEDAVDALRA